MPLFKPLSVVLIIFGQLAFAYAQDACFGTQRVPMIDIVDLEQKNGPVPLASKVREIKPGTAKPITQGQIKSLSMNGGAPEDVMVTNYQNASGELVASYTYGGKKFYRVRNDKTKCVALYVLNKQVIPATISLAMSFENTQGQDFFKSGLPVADWKDADLEGIAPQTEENGPDCKVIEGGEKLFSMVSSYCGRVKLCRLEAICRSSGKTETAYCKAIDEGCPDFTSCQNDSSIKELYKDLQEGSMRKEEKPSAKSR